MLRLARPHFVAVAVGWLVLLILNAIGEAVIRVRASRPDAIDAHLIRQPFSCK